MGRRGENIYKRKDGRYEGRYRAGFRDDGKPRYRSVYARTYHEVSEKLYTLKAEPPSCPAGRLTVKRLFEEWLSAAQLRVKASTLANYRMKADKHILPEFGAFRYEQLTPRMLHDFMQRKLRSGLSPKYVSDIVTVFKTMAKYASRVHGFRNPIADVILPRAERREPELLSTPQQKRLTACLMKNLNPTSLCILLSLYTGLRIGEVCGLRWDDIDFGKSILTVRRTVQRINTGAGTRLLTDAPKSRTSRRSIPVPVFLMELLQRLRKDDGYVLSGTDRPTEPRTLQKRFKAILQKAGLPSIRYHSLRHQFATNCIRLGFDVKTLAEILGHASVEITLRLYVHSSMERKTECMNRVTIAA